MSEAQSATVRRAIPRDAAAAGERWTLVLTASATLLVLAVFSAGVTTVGETARTLHAGVAGQTWALSAMSLGLASALLAVGALADDLGRRRVLAWSAGLLAFASGLAAAAPNMAVFVAARVLQGVAGAGVLTASLGGDRRRVPRRRRPHPGRPASGGRRSAAASRSARSRGAASPTRSGGAAATGCRRSPPRRSFPRPEGSPSRARRFRARSTCPAWRLLGGRAWPA